jgi:hypothetical protein
MGNAYAKPTMSLGDIFSAFPAWWTIARRMMDSANQPDQARQL